MSNDFLRIMAAVEAIYETIGNSQKWPQALEVIATALDAVGTALITISHDGTATAVTSPRIIRAQIEYAQGWSEKDFTIRRAIEHSYKLGKDAVSDRDVGTEHERATDPFYTVFLASHGIGTVMSVSASPSPQTVVRLAAQGSTNRKWFDDSDSKLLEHMGKHCERALMLSCRLEELEDINASLAEAVSRVSFGVFLLDETGELIQANEYGRALFGNGIKIVGGKLVAEGGAHARALEQAIQSVHTANPLDRLRCTQPVVIHRQGDQRPLVAYLVPLRTAEAVSPWAPLKKTGLLCLISDLAGAPELDPALVRDYLGLTLGEARVAAQIGVGRSPTEAAEKLGISVETVRTVVKRIFSKSATSRQGELVAELTKLGLIRP